MYSLCIDHAESLVARGGLYVNSVRIESVNEKVCPDRHLLGGAITVLRIGNYIVCFTVSVANTFLLFSL